MQCSMQSCVCLFGVASHHRMPSLSNSYGEAVNEIARGLVGARGLGFVALMNPAAGARSFTDQRRALDRIAITRSRAALKHPTEPHLRAQPAAIFTSEKKSGGISTSNFHVIRIGFSDSCDTYRTRPRNR